MIDDLKSKEIKITERIHNEKGQRNEEKSREREKLLATSGHRGVTDLGDTSWQDQEPINDDYFHDGNQKQGERYGSGKYVYLFH